MGVRPFLLPDLGEGLQEAEIVEWHVSEGDRVVADQPLVSVETDKAVVEVPSPWSGTVTALRAQPGDVLEIGAVLAEIDDGAREDQGAIVGRLEPELTPAPPARPAPAPRILAAPAVRAKARTLGMDLTALQGTGPQGAITLADLETAAPATKPAQGSAARRSMARAMARSGAAVVPATVTDVAEVTGWYTPEADVMVRLVRAISAAAIAQPQLNTWYDPDPALGPQPAGVALGIAVDTDQGLYVPVIANADKLSAAETRQRIDAAIARIRDRRPDPAAPGTPTITLSNFGPIGGRHAQLVVVPPQVAILGAGRAYQTVHWQDGAPAPAIELPLSLSFDHRAVTGGEAARFLAALVADLEQPT